MNNKFLGIDYGDKRIGLALAEGRGPALPFQVIDNDGALWEKLKELVDKERINKIIVGLPHSFSGQDNERQKLTREFISKLESYLSLDVDVIDEQLTSKLYEKMGVKKDIDKHAATAILDTYLNSHD